MHNALYSIWMHSSINLAILLSESWLCHTLEIDWVENCYKDWKS